MAADQEKFASLWEEYNARFVASKERAKTVGSIDCNSQTDVSGTNMVNMTESDAAVLSNAYSPEVVTDMMEMKEDEDCVGEDGYATMDVNDVDEHGGERSWEGGFDSEILVDLASSAPIQVMDADKGTVLDLVEIDRSMNEDASTQNDTEREVHLSPCGALSPLPGDAMENKLEEGVQESSSLEPTHTAERREEEGVQESSSAPTVTAERGEEEGVQESSSAPTVTAERMEEECVQEFSVPTGIAENIWEEGVHECSSAPTNIIELNSDEECVQARSSSAPADTVENRDEAEGVQDSRLVDAMDVQDSDVIPEGSRQTGLVEKVEEPRDSGSIPSKFEVRRFICGTHLFCRRRHVLIFRINLVPPFYQMILPIFTPLVHVADPNFSPATALPSGILMKALISRVSGMGFVI